MNFEDFDKLDLADKEKIQRQAVLDWLLCTVSAVWDGTYPLSNFSVFSTIGKAQESGNIDYEEFGRIASELAEEHELVSPIDYKKLCNLNTTNNKIWHSKNYIDNTVGKKLSNYKNKFFLQVMEEHTPHIKFDKYVIFRTCQPVGIEVVKNGEECVKQIKDCIFVLPENYQDYNLHSTPVVTRGEMITGIWDLVIPTEEISKVLGVNATGIFLLTGYTTNPDKPYPFKTINYDYQSLNPENAFFVY
jgi:hypothetical protein